MKRKNYLSAFGALLCGVSITLLSTGVDAGSRGGHGYGKGGSHAAMHRPSVGTRAWKGSSNFGAGFRKSTSSRSWNHGKHFDQNWKRYRSQKSKTVFYGTGGYGVNVYTSFNSSFYIDYPAPLVIYSQRTFVVDEPRRVLRKVRKPVRRMPACKGSLKDTC